MRKIREVLRLKHELRRSHRKIANSTVSDFLESAWRDLLACVLRM